MTDCEHSQAEAAACEALEDAVEDKRVVTFQYKKANGSVSTRTLSPYEVTGDITEGNLKVLGWDHERKALRSFKIDHHQMAEVQVAPDAEYQEPVDRG